MITKLRLSDSASLGDNSTNSNCDQTLAAGDDSNSEKPLLGDMNSVGQSSSDQQSTVGTKYQGSSHKKPTLGPLASDDSCNAVDNKLSGECELMENRATIGGTDLTFNGRITSLTTDLPTDGPGIDTTVAVVVEIAPMDYELIDATKGFERDDTEPAEGSNRLHARKDQRNESYELLTKEKSSWLHYKNEKSPDLFADDDNDTEDNAEDEPCQNVYTENDDADEEVEAASVRQAKQRTSGASTCELDCAFEDTRVDSVERVLLKRLQSSISGVPPPPSLTFSNINVDSMYALYHSNAQQWWDAFRRVSGDDGAQTDRQLAECLSKPTHLTTEVASIGWPDLLKSRAHGIHYNKSTVSEKLELLGLKYVERYIGAETSSSFNMTHSPSSAKKRNQRMKMLNQSPGSRLSHLARRRAIFSSANLLNTSGSSSRTAGCIVSAGKCAINSSALNRLNPFRLCNRQVLLDPKKSDNRRKNKVKTPQRRSPGLGRKSPRRRTPGSSAKKLTLARSSTSSKPSQQLHVPVTRETSKRALFLSPSNKATSSSCFEQVNPVGSNSNHTDRLMLTEARMLRSKRSLFSPARCPAANEGLNTTSGKQVQVELLAMGRTSTATATVSLKRRRSQMTDSEEPTPTVSGERTEKIRRKESFALTEEDLTPRSLKFARSQSFCVGSQTVSQIGSQIGPLIAGKSLFRANSEITSEDGNRPVMMLTENHKKKLLWAVSQALKDKQVPTKHEMFKQHASNLARVVKRLFLEFNDQTISSTSEKLLRLANKHVYEVIQGRCVDDIYFREKTRLMNVRNLTKLQGYIAPEEYELRMLRRAGSMASMAASSFEGASPFDGSFSASQNFLSQASIFSQGSTIGGSFSQLSDAGSGGSVALGRPLKAAASTGSVHTAGLGAVAGVSLGTTALRENIDSELRQRSTQKQLTFSGKDQKNVSPYRMDKGCPTIASGNSNANNKLLVGGAFNSSIMKAKRQISFE